MDAVLVKLGEKLQQARKVAGLTQTQVEEVVGLNQVQLSYYETGKREISITLLEKLATLYGYSTDYFMNNTTNQTQDFQIAFRAEELTTEDIEVVNWAKSFVGNLFEMNQMKG